MTALLGVGAFVGINVSKINKIEKVEAATPTSAETHYFNVYSSSIKDWEAWNVNVWDATNGVELPFESLGHHLYSFQWPTNCATVIQNERNKFNLKTPPKSKSLENICDSLFGC